jgi:hypothetical protein
LSVRDHDGSAFELPGVVELTDDELTDDELKDDELKLSRQSRKFRFPAK